MEPMEAMAAVLTSGAYIPVQEDGPMKRYLTTLLAVASAAAIGACAPAAPEVNAPADIAAVSALRNSFVKAFNSGDAEAAGNVYTIDAMANGNHQPTSAGRAAIVAADKAFFSQMSATMELTSEDTKTMGTGGYDRGRYKLTLTPKAGGPAIVDEGRYLVLLQKGPDGAWKVSYDIDNSSMPMPMPPPPPAAAPAKGKGK
jgi:uncharacterized protein (TIGR02246 family)